MIHYGKAGAGPPGPLLYLEWGTPRADQRSSSSLLSLLLSHPGRTFNRIYLVETIWKSSYIEGDRAVDNAILRLRKKLSGMEDCLETVRGMGYRMRRMEPPAAKDPGRPE